jgi:hypothetical protein
LVGGYQCFNRISCFYIQDNVNEAVNLTSCKGIRENEKVMQVGISGTIDPTGAHAVGQVEVNANIQA